jgi:hypothetical protein
MADVGAILGRKPGWLSENERSKTRLTDPGWGKKENIQR